MCHLDKITRSEFYVKDISQEESVFYGAYDVLKNCDWEPHEKMSTLFTIFKTENDKNFTHYISRKLGTLSYPFLTVFNLVEN